MNDVIQSQNEKGRGCATSIVVAFLIIGLFFLYISFVALVDNCQPSFVPAPGDESASSLCELQDLLGWGFLFLGVGFVVVSFAISFTSRKKSQFQQ